MTTVLVAGTFDILHAGHEDFFRQAKTFGERLVVIVARDATTLRIKGKAPTSNEVLRLDAIEHCPLVDKARLGNPDDLFSSVVEEKPDVVCLGYDQHMDKKKLKDELAKRGLHVTLHRLSAFKPDVYKSSLLLKQTLQ